MRKPFAVVTLISLLVVLVQGTCFAQSNAPDDVFELITDDTYKAGPADSREKAEALGLFGAKYKAVALAAKYLIHKGLLKNYGKKQTEIYCLATKEIETVTIETRLADDGQTYRIKIQSRVQSTDFIRAEIRNAALEKREKRFSLQEELEQYVYQQIDPALELSRAYRYLRQNLWRMAVIYLDHLEKKYPRWDEIYMAKAIGLYATHKKGGMMAALRTACALGNREACEDIEGLKKSFDKPLTLPYD